jgi:hypothetical protein
MKNPIQRRSILQAMAVAPLATLLPTHVAFAAAPPDMSPEDPLGKAMKYVEDASKADPMRTDKTAFCHNCAKFAKCPTPAVQGCVPGKKTDKRAACEIFQGKHVNRNGWCMSWQKA